MITAAGSHYLLKDYIIMLCNTVVYIYVV